MKRIFALLAVLCILSGAVLSGGCFAVPDPSDERSLGSQYDDAGVKTSIATAMLKESATKANDVNVHCFQGHVFLIGEAEPAFRRFCVETAQKTKGVAHVTTHWFADRTSNTLSDTALEAQIDGHLLFAKNVPSTQVVVDVWGGNVVLTGIMADQSDIDRTVATVRGIDGVHSVTSYLTVYQRK